LFFILPNGEWWRRVLVVGELTVILFAHFVAPHRHSVDGRKDNFRADRLRPLKGGMAVFADQQYLKVAALELTRPLNL
jgi:hypothetical protein